MKKIRETAGLAAAFLTLWLVILFRPPVSGGQAETETAAAENTVTAEQLAAMDETFEAAKEESSAETDYREEDEGDADAVTDRTDSKTAEEETGSDGREEPETQNAVKEESEEEETDGSEAEAEPDDEESFLTLRQRKALAEGTISAAVRRAVAWMVETAQDNRHGYSQANRNGPDYDCSSLVYTGFRRAGILHCGVGTTRTLLSDFKKYGFVDVTDYVNVKNGRGLQMGDVLWRTGHVEVYCGGGYRVGAHGNKDGVQGDSSGREIDVRRYSNNGWEHVLRYVY